jgi:hypothetical protein
MFRFIVLSIGTLVRLWRARQSLLENLALRQQLAVLKPRHPKPRIGLFDKLFWVAVHRFWSGWKQSLIVVTPETVVWWHRAGFRLYWRLTSRISTHVGRRPTSKEIRELIFQVVAENPTWGAPRIYGALQVAICSRFFCLTEGTAKWNMRAQCSKCLPDGKWRGGCIRFTVSQGKPTSGDDIDEQIRNFEASGRVFSAGVQKIKHSKAEAARASSRFLKWPELRGWVNSPWDTLPRMWASEEAPYPGSVQFQTATSGRIRGRPNSKLRHRP